MRWFSMNKIFLIALLLTCLSINTEAKGSPDSHIRVNPKVKLGKYENGNHFMELLLGKFNWRINEVFSFAGGASVGFTAPRSSFTKMNHYMNLLVLRATYRPPFLGNLGVFVEGGFSNLIEGNSNPVGYFRTALPGGGSGNYQAIGFEFDWLEITRF